MNCLICVFCRVNKKCRIIKSFYVTRFHFCSHFLSSLLSLSCSLPFSFLFFPLPFFYFTVFSLGFILSSYSHLVSLSLAPFSFPFSLFLSSILYSICSANSFSNYFFFFCYLLIFWSPFLLRLSSIFLILRLFPFSNSYFSLSPSSLNN